MVVRWQCAKVAGGVDIHVVYLINMSRIKKKKEKKHYQWLDMSQALLSLLGAMVVELYAGHMGSLNSICVSIVFF
jgi:endonuclease IV